MKPEILNRLLQSEKEVIKNEAKTCFKTNKKDKRFSSLRDSQQLEDYKNEA